MSLILAIEPDRRQTAQLVAIARGKLHVELVLADTTAQAIAELGNRVPDLILTSALLSPKDDAALAECLRALDGAVAHVQTLTIPVLATPTARRRASKGMLSRLRGNRTHAAPEGCDPEVFADQIGEYLRRGGEERQSREEEAVEAPTTIGELVGLEVAAGVALPERPEADDRSVFADAGPRDVLPPGDDVPSTHKFAPVEEEPIAGDATPPDAPGPTDHELLAQKLAPAEEGPVAGAVTPPAALGPAEHAPLAHRLALAEDPSVVGDVELAGNVSPASSELFAADVVPRVREAVAGEVTVVIEEASATCAAGTCEIDSPAYEVLPLPTVTVAIDERERRRVPSSPTGSSAPPITSVAVVMPVPPPPPIASVSAVVPVPLPPPVARALAVEPVPLPPPIARVSAVVSVPPPPPIARVSAVVPVPPMPPMARASAVVAVPPTPSGEAPLDAQPAGPVARPEWLVTMEELERQLEGLQQLSIQSPSSSERTIPPPPEPPKRAAPGTPDVPERVKPGRRTARPRKRDRPVQDEWGFFDPAQCGFAALLTKLDEVTEDADNPSKPLAPRTK
jgi:hypothetical protein